MVGDLGHLVWENKVTDDRSYGELGKQIPNIGITWRGGSWINLLMFESICAGEHLKAVFVRPGALKKDTIDKHIMCSLLPDLQDYDK